MNDKLDFTNFIESWNNHSSERMELEILDDLNSPSQGSSALRQGSSIDRSHHGLDGSLNVNSIDNIDPHHQKNTEGRKICTTELQSPENDMVDIESISGRSNFIEAESVIDDPGDFEDDDSSDIFDNFLRREMESEAETSKVPDEAMPGDPIAPDGPMTPLIFGGVRYDNVPANKFPLRSAYFEEYKREEQGTVPWKAEKVTNKVYRDKVRPRRKSIKQFKNRGSRRPLYEKRRK